MKCTGLAAIALSMACVGMGSGAVLAQEAAPAAQAQPRALDLNTASAAEFETLPGIGQAIAARIVEYREQHGPFTKVEELMNVRGIGERVFLTLKPQITVTPPPVAAE